MWAPKGKQVEVPIEGALKRIALTGVLSIGTGALWLYGSEEYTKETFEEILLNIRLRWRAWEIVLFTDKMSAQNCWSSRQYARSKGIEIRFLPTACAELNLMDQLWKTAKGDIAANEPTPKTMETVRRVSRYLYSLSPTERLTKAGAYAPDFWLKDFVKRRGE
jgi:hypothetical protein